MAATSAQELGEVKVLEIDGNHAKGIAGNMLFLVWRYETQVDAYVRARELLVKLQRSHAAGLGIVQVIEDTALPPDAVTRAEFPKLLEVADECVKHYSVVHEGTGFKAAAVRAITSGAYFMSRHQFPHEVFASLDKAATWHAAQQPPLGFSRNPASIVAAVTTMRQRLEAVPPPPGR